MKRPAWTDPWSETYSANVYSGDWTDCEGVSNFSSNVYLKKWVLWICNCFNRDSSSRPGRAEQTDLGPVCGAVGTHGLFPGFQSLISPSPSSSICRPITSSCTFFFCPFFSTSVSGFSDWVYQGWGAELSQVRPPLRKPPLPARTSPQPCSWASELPSCTPLVWSSSLALRDDILTGTVLPNLE